MLPSSSKRDATFLESMTFTSVRAAKCECDECCITDSNGLSNLTPIPEAIRAAVEHRKRIKQTQILVKRSQVRNLVTRHDTINNFAVWEWTMPVSAEPIVEFGNPLIYRIIWIKRLPKIFVIKHIGKGIVGSKSEEEGRQQLNWIENDVIFASSMDKKSVGYIVEPSKDENHDGHCDVQLKSATVSPSGPVVMYIAKIPVDCIPTSDEDRQELTSLDQATNNTCTTFEVLRRICRRAIMSKTDSNKQSLFETLFRLADDDQELFRETITAVVIKSKIV